MLTEQPVGQRLTTEQALDRSHAKIKVVVRRVGIFRLRKEYFVQLSNGASERPGEHVEYSVPEWTDFVDNARYAVRDEKGGVLIGRVYWRKPEWDALLVAIAKGGLIRVLMHLPRIA